MCEGRDIVVGRDSAEKGQSCPERFRSLNLSAMTGSRLGRLSIQQAGGRGRKGSRKEVIKSVSRASSSRAKIGAVAAEAKVSNGTGA